MGIFVIKFKYLNDNFHIYSGSYIKECLYDEIKQLKLDYKYSKNKPILF